MMNLILALVVLGVCYLVFYGIAYGNPFATFTRWLLKEIHAARHPRKIKRTPKKDGDHVTIYVRPEDGPVVETKHAVLPLSRVPLISDKANAKRIALEYARKRTGNPDLPWKTARKMLAAWGRLERQATV